MIIIILVIVILSGRNLLSAVVSYIILGPMGQCNGPIISLCGPTIKIFPYHMIKLIIAATMVIVVATYLLIVLCIFYYWYKQEHLLLSYLLSNTVFIVPSYCLYNIPYHKRIAIYWSVCRYRTATPEEKQVDMHSNMEWQMYISQRIFWRVIQWWWTTVQDKI